MHDTVGLETLGIPTAAVITSEFVEEARTQTHALGMPEIEPAVIDHPLSTLPDSEIEARARQALPLVRAIWLGLEASQV